MMVLDGLWHFHPGDNPQWADSSFDDSKWPLINFTQSWSDHGYKVVSGTAWYRARIVISKNETKLAIFIPRMDDSYQVFANGKHLTLGFTGNAEECNSSLVQ